MIIEGKLRHHHVEVELRRGNSMPFPHGKYSARYISSTLNDMNVPVAVLTCSINFYLSFEWIQEW